MSNQYTVPTLGGIITTVDKDMKALDNCDIGLQYEGYIATFLYHIHVWVKVHPSNCKQVKVTR